jgi:RNA polymerase sigma-70 factor, ECF subfamily
MTRSPARLVTLESSLDAISAAQAVRAGNSAALAVLYDAYASTLYETAYRLCGNGDDAQDIVHDCFVGLPQALRHYDERGTLEAWLRRIVVRLALMRRRAAHRRPEVSIEDTAPVALASNSRSDAGVELDDLRREIAELPEALRDVLVLKQVEGYSHEEIASLLGISAGASRARLSRALHMLMGVLAPRR